jgi:hypothetical protein
MNIHAQFALEGYAVCKGVLGDDELKALRNSLDQSLAACAKQLQCSLEDYLSAVSRWADPSLVTTGFHGSVLETIKCVSEQLVLEQIELKKLNVIGKNAHCTGETPFHQDIVYSPNDPYQFSAWLALNDVTESCGPLEVIPKSHLQSIKPAVDFWSPDYFPDSLFEAGAVKIPVKAGDVIFFDSRLWHGSRKNFDRAQRYAFVTRWKTRSWKLTEKLPPIEPLFFGMWTCGGETKKLLDAGMRKFFEEQEDSFTLLLDKWLRRLKGAHLPFSYDSTKAQEALKKVKILHLASEKHYGGDAIGEVYKHLWNVFLYPLSLSLSEIPACQNT